MDHYEAKHAGIIPVIFVKCEQCGALAGWDLNNKRCTVCGVTAEPSATTPGWWLPGEHTEETPEQKDIRAARLRATEAIDAVDAYSIADDPATDASDLIADLMHYAEHHGLDWGGLMVRAHMHFSAER